MKQIVVEISSCGSVKIDAQGFKGAGCAKATEKIEIMLGGEGAASKKKKKPEFFQTPGTQAANKLTF